MMADIRGGGNYFDAAQQRHKDAVLLFKHNQYSGASYLAGCAIEAMFWAFIPENERVSQRGRHDLQILYEVGLGAKFEAIYVRRFRLGAVRDNTELQNFDRLTREISINMTNARLRWKNSYRYYPDSKLRELVRKTRPVRTSKPGDILRSSVNILLEACQFFIALGIQKQGWIG